MTTRVEWLEISEINEGLKHNSYGTNTDLAGREETLTFENGGQAVYKFNAEDLTRETAGETLAASYKCIKIDESLYLAWYRQPAAPTNQTLVLLDFDSNQATEFYGLMPTLEEAKCDLITMAFTEFCCTRVKLEYQSASLNGGPVKPVERTTEIVGNRVRWTYSETDIYEHIYLNPSFYSWQCLEGPEKGLADTDHCDYFKLREKLYLFVWREKLVPTMGFIATNYRGGNDALQSNGTLFGINTVNGAPEGGEIVGAKGKLVNYTENKEVM